jgi:hypothetical protein
MGKCNMRYRVKIEKGDFEANAPGNGGYHACDALIYIPIKFGEPCDCSQHERVALMVCNVDGRRPDGDDAISDAQMMVVWASWALALSQSKTLPRKVSNLAAVMWQGAKQILGLDGTHFERRQPLDEAAEKKAEEAMKSALAALAREEKGSGP